MVWSWSVDVNCFLLRVRHMHDRYFRPIIVLSTLGLTFLYTHCPGPCPLMAEKLRSTAELLGTQANQVTWLAVSLDPKEDTPASATAFVETHRLTGQLHYLLGTRAELEPTWKAYAIGV